MQKVIPHTQITFRLLLENQHFGFCFSLNQGAIREGQEEEKAETEEEEKEKREIMDSATTQRLSISLLATLCLILIHSTSANSTHSNPNAYDVLRQYDFPVGLLPRGLKGYDLDSTTGEFSAYFNESCSFSVQGSYEMKFKSTITGYISRGTLSGLSGVSVKFFLLSLNIVGILRNGDSLVISAGAESAPFPIDNFEESPQCGCGFQCAV